MSNFESKHPRARDGKFTEKNRAESGLTLELEPDNCPEPKSTVSTAGRKMIGELYNGETLDRRAFRSSSDGGKVFDTFEFYRENGQVWARRYRDISGKRLHSTEIPYEEFFNYDGSLRSVAYDPTEDQVKDHFANSNEEIVLEKSYTTDGALARKIYLSYSQEESVIEWNAVAYDKEGNETMLDWEDHRELSPSLWQSSLEQNMAGQRSKPVIRPHRRHRLW